MSALTRSRDEGGAITVIFALLLIVFMIMAALAIDAARLYEERRQLQTTADAAALAGASAYPEGALLAEATGQAYVGVNPTTYHTGAYDPGAGDVVDATTCDVDGVAYQCVKATISSPDVELFFGRAFGRETAGVVGRASAVIGNAAVGGDKLVPWMIRDCPDAYGQNRGFVDEQANAAALVAEMDRIGLVCPHRFSENYSSGQTTLFLSSSTGGNFQGADLNNTPDCPIPSGYFSGSSGASSYRGFLAGDGTDSWFACPIGPGARVQPKPGGMAGPTNQGLNLRNVDSCRSQASFEAAIDHGRSLTDGYVIFEDLNPCVMVVVMVVTAEQDPPPAGLLTEGVPGNIRAMQNDVLIDPFPNDNNQVKWRFGELTNGASDVYIVRRLAYFYLTNREPYTGLFLRGNTSQDSVLSGPYDPAAGVFITRLVE